MRQTIQIMPNDKIELASDWGLCSGIQIGDITITMLGSKVVANVLAALQDLQREYDDRAAREAGLPTEAESAREWERSAEDEKWAYAYQDALYDRQVEDRAMEDRAEAGIE